MGWPFSSFSSLPYLFGTAPLLEGLAFEQLLKPARLSWVAPFPGNGGPEGGAEVQPG